MRLRTLILFFFLSFPLFSESADIIYYKFFGEYLTEKIFHIDIDVNRDSIKDIKNALQKLRNRKDAIDSDLVLIGYGPNSSVEEFFAATTFTDQQVPLSTALGKIPPKSSHATWYIIFVHRGISHYVREQKDHHPTSPFRWLARVGLQDLSYFGTDR